MKTILLKLTNATVCAAGLAAVIYAVSGANLVQAQTTITVDPSTRHQKMASGCWEAHSGVGFIDFPTDTRVLAMLPQVLDQAVNDLGLNRIRLERNGASENTVDYWTPYINGELTRPEARRGMFSIINDNNDPFTINWNGFVFSWIDYQMEKVILPLRQLLAARGETLFVHLHGTYDSEQEFFYRDNPEEFAEYLLAIHLHLKDKYNFVLDAVELVNEPDGAGSTSASRMGQMALAAGNRLKAHGFTPRFIVASTVSMANAVPYFNTIISTPGVLPYLSELSYHRYAGASTATLQTIAQRGLQRGIGTAMLEHIGSGYADLHQDLKVGRNVAWEQYTLAGPLTSPAQINTADNGGAYYLMDLTNSRIIMGSRTKLLRQYFKFIRGGAQRIEATTTSGSFDPVAFINTDGRYVVVVKAGSSGSLAVNGLPAGTYGIKYTTSSQYDIDLSDVTITAGQSVSAGIPAAGVLTVYRKGPALRILSPQQQSGSFELLLTDLTAGIPYTVQRTESLSSSANWSNVFTWTANTNARPWSDSTAERTNAFYRVRSGP